MEGLVAPALQSGSGSLLFGGCYRGKRVFVTGHTGFKGSWLCEWLISLGARVTGYSLAPPTSPALFEQLELARRVERHHVADVRDLPRLQSALSDAAPDFLFHLAAQPLVRASYEMPAETFATNVQGTVNVLDALRTAARPCAAVIVTTDKVYQNQEWQFGYREDDRLGGHDPYSASKAAAELVVAAYRDSFFRQGSVRLASARAGNVLGGGDWALDRLVPDCVRSLAAGKSVPVRNPGSCRPWQHVLDPLSGYLWLAALLAQPELHPGALAERESAFNFGPDPGSNRTVLDLVKEILRHWPGAWHDASDPGAAHEAVQLQLATDRARARLGWRPVWDFSSTIARTMDWYGAALGQGEKGDPAALTRRQLAAFEQRAVELGLPWTVGGAR